MNLTHLHAIEDASALKIHGGIDFYYSYNLNQPSPVTPPSAPDTHPPAGNNLYHVFDIYHDNLSLALAEITLEKSLGEVSGLINLGFGNNTDILSPNDEVSKNVLQAYLTYAPSEIPNLSISVGKMYTHLGLEVTKSRDNWNYSRSILFGYSGPFWHTGIAIRYALLEQKLNAGFFVYNENNGLYETGRSKSLGFQIQSVQIQNLNITYNFLAGSEKDLVATKHTRILNEANATYNILPDFAVAADIIWGQLTHIAGDTAHWLAWSTALKWDHGPLYISPRYELYLDKNGATIETATATRPSLPQRTQSLTLTSAYDITEDLQTRLEVRQERSSSGIFLDAEGDLHNSQTTLTLSVLYDF